MQITAFSAPPHPDWRWRIVGYDGETLEESWERFPTIAAALEGGAARLARLSTGDRASGIGRY